MIGVSTTCVESCIDWLAFLLDKNIKTIELNHLFTPLYFNPEYISKFKKAIKENSLDISMHSGTTYLLHPDPDIAKAQLSLFQSEITFASLAGIKYINFHLHSSLKLNNKVFTFLESIIDLASKNNITLCLENNSSGNFSTPENLIKIFSKFKSLYHVIDVGHLNIVANSSPGKFSDYLKQLKPYTKYLHFHDNYGTKDEHNEIGKGNINFDVVFNHFDKNKTRIILETRNFSSAINSIKTLNQYN